jgi:indole-3-glycerol phosphate synthase
MLNKIVQNKCEEVKRLKVLKKERIVPLLDMPTFLNQKPFILEIKKKSPSKGVLAENLNIKKQAKEYVKYGCGGISVLTDKKYFNGELEDIAKVKETVFVPVLCKDFVVDEKQIENAFLIGADSILLIVAVLSEKRLFELYKKAIKLGLTVLFEIHQLQEFDKIKHLDLQMVGVNSRDLKTMNINLEKAKSVLKKLNGNFLKVAESGIKTKSHIKEFTKCGANAFLIGTTLMQAKDKERLMNEFYLALNNGE